MTCLYFLFQKLPSLFALHLETKTTPRHAVLFAHYLLESLLYHSHLFLELLVQEGVGLGWVGSFLRSRELFYHGFIFDHGFECAI